MEGNGSVMPATSPPSPLLTASASSVLGFKGLDGGDERAQGKWGGGGGGAKSPQSSSSVLSCLSVLLREVRLADRRRLFSVYRQCFVATEAVLLLQRLLRCSQSEAVVLLQLLLQQGLIQHADTQHPITAQHGHGVIAAQAVPPFEHTASSYYQFTPLALQAHTQGVAPASSIPYPSSRRSPSVSVTEASRSSASPSSSPSVASSTSSASTASSSSAASASSTTASHPILPTPSFPLSSPSSSSSSSSSSSFHSHAATAAPSPSPVDATSSMVGWLDKRAEGGLHSYQRRYFVLSLRDASLSYYRQPSSVFPLHFIPLSDVLWVHQLMEAKKGCRFDVVVPHRVISLLADSPQTAVQWVTAISRACKEHRDRLAERANNRNRMAEPRTPTLLQPFWQQGHGYVAMSAMSAASHAALSSPSLSPSPSSAFSSRVSPLKAAFFQLHFSVSALNQPDFFHDLLEDFHTDDDILAFLLDAAIHPDTNEHAARAILYSRDAVLRGRDAMLSSAAAAACSSRLQHSKGSFQAEDSGKGNKLQQPTHNRQTEGRKEEDKQDSNDEPSLTRSLDTPLKPQASEGRQQGGKGHPLTRSSSSFSRLPPPSTLRRTRSDLSLDVVHLTALPRASSTSATGTRSRTDDDVGFVSPSSRLRASLPSLPRYELFRASANRSKERMTDGRKKVLNWLGDGGAIKALSSPSLLNHRLTLPLLWAALQSRHHEEADDGAGGAAGSGGGGVGGGGMHTIKLARARRSSSFDADPSGSNSLMALFRQAGPASAQSASPASPLSPAASSAPAQAPPPLSSPHSSSSGSTSSPSASPSSSPFRSHLTTVVASSTPSTSLYPERDSGGVHRSPPATVASLFPSRPAGMLPPRPAAVAFHSPSSGKASGKESHAWDSPHSNGGGSAGNTSRYATVRIASAGQLNQHAVTTLSFATRGLGRRMSGTTATPSLAPSHWLHSYSSQCPHCRSAAKAFADALATAFASSSSGGGSSGAAGGVPFSTLHVNALLSILVTPVESLLWMDNVSSPSHSVFAHAVVNAGVWPALLCQLQRADSFVQKRALKDINGVLVAANVGSANCESLLQVGGWQCCVLPLLFPRSSPSPSTAGAASSSPLYAASSRERSSSASRSHQRSSSTSSSTSSRSAAPSAPSSGVEQSLRERVDSFVLNILGVVHYHAFVTLSPDAFTRVFHTSMTLAMKWSGGGQHYRVPRSLLLVMMQRIINKVKAKLLDMDDRWPALEALLSFVRAFVLCLPLQSPPPAITGREGGQKATVSPPSTAALPSSLSTMELSSLLSSSCAVLDFGELRPIGRWKRSLLEDRDLIERALLLMRQLRLYQDVDLAALSNNRAIAIKEHIQHAQPTFTATATPAAMIQPQQPAQSLVAPSSASLLPPSASGTVRSSLISVQHRRAPSSAAVLHSLPSLHSLNPSALSSSTPPPASPSPALALSLSLSSSSLRCDLFHPLNRFKLNAQSEDLAIEFLSWNAADRTAFLSLQQQVGLYKDTATFLSILATRTQHLHDDTLHMLLQHFTAVDKRDKTFSWRTVTNIDHSQQPSSLPASAQHHSAPSTQLPPPPRHAHHAASSKSSRER